MNIIGLALIVIACIAYPPAFFVGLGLVGLLILTGDLT